MKKLLLAGTLFFLSAQNQISAQKIEVYKIENLQSILKTDAGGVIINNTIQLEKGDQVLINIPLQKNFVFIRKKQKKFGLKLLSSVSDIVGTGASIVGLNSQNINVINSSIKVVNATNSISLATDVFEKVDELNISKQAKKIVGKKADIVDIVFTDDGYTLEVEIDKKNYEINLQEALVSNEIKLLTNTKNQKQ